MKTAGYVALFAAIQLLSVPLALMGLAVCAYFALQPNRIVRRMSTIGAPKNISQFEPRWAWLWNNDEDGCDGGPLYHPSWHNADRIFVWSAIRNTVNNLRRVRYVSGKGRPLYYRTWVLKGKQFYFKAGWSAPGYPMLSFGAGKGY